MHTGLLNLVDNQDQLAVVIGHEVGHVMARHSNERLSQQAGTNLGISLIQAIATPQSALGQTAVGLLGIGAQYGVIMPFSRLHESEADTIGLDLMAKAGFNPAESIRLWQKMAQASQGAEPVEFCPHILRILPVYRICRQICRGRNDYSSRQMLQERIPAVPNRLIG